MRCVIENDPIVKPLSSPDSDESAGTGGSQSTRSIEDSNRDWIVAADPGTARFHISGYCPLSGEVIHAHYSTDQSEGVSKHLNSVAEGVRDFISQNLQYTGSKSLVLIEDQFTPKMAKVAGVIFGTFSGTDLEMDVRTMSSLTVKKHFRLKRARDDPSPEAPLSRSKRYRFNKETALIYVNEKKLLGEENIVDHNEADNLLMIQYAIDNKL